MLFERDTGLYKLYSVAFGGCGISWVFDQESIGKRCKKMVVRERAPGMCSENQSEVPMYANGRLDKFQQSTRGIQNTLWPKRLWKFM